MMLNMGNAFLTPTIGRMANRNSGAQLINSRMAMGYSHHSAP